MNTLLSRIKAATVDAPLRREMPIAAKVLDEKAGLVRFTASDETMDHANEIVRLSGWRFTYFAKNRPFVNSHNYHDVRELLGKVVGYGVEGDALVEDVQFALTPRGDSFADWVFAMYRDDFLRACSVGFIPLRYATRWDQDKGPLAAQAQELELDAAAVARLACVYIEQEQIELSGCILGCNPNALQRACKTIAQAYRAGSIGEEAVESLSARLAGANPETPAADRADAGASRRRARLAVLMAIQKATRS